MSAVLEGQEFCTEGADRYIKLCVWGWPIGEGRWEKGVVVCYVDVGDVVLGVVVEASGCCCECAVRECLG